MAQRPALTFSPESNRKTKQQDLSLWQRLNLVCVAFGITDARAEQITAVPAAILQDFRQGQCHATPEEAERIRIFVNEVERLSSCALRHFKLEFAPLENL